jgi:hypothetical protein
MKPTQEQSCPRPPLSIITNKLQLILDTFRFGGFLFFDGLSALLLLFHNYKTQMAAFSKTA